jgi:hypothetical protein
MVLISTFWVVASIVGGKGSKWLVLELGDNSLTPNGIFRELAGWTPFDSLVILVGYSSAVIPSI